MERVVATAEMTCRYCGVTVDGGTKCFTPGIDAESPGAHSGTHWCIGAIGAKLALLEAEIKTKKDK